MPAQWTGDLIGKMHVSGITAKQLAETAGVHPKYLSAILNGHRNPPDAEQRFRLALDELILEQDYNTTKTDH